MIVEDVVSYYGRQLDKVKEARQHVKSPWGREWLATLERQLKRKMDWKLIDMQTNRSYHVDTRHLEER